MRLAVGVAEPGWVFDGAVIVRTGLEEFKLSSHGGVFCLREYCRDLLSINGPEAFYSLERLIEDPLRIDPSDDYRRR